MTNKEELARRRALSNDEAMRDAETICAPCKLCGGKAEISDAGVGWGYYIRCENARTRHPAKGCMIEEQRLSGWAYNVADWWNRLHASQPVDKSGQGEGTSILLALAAERQS